MTAGNGNGHVLGHGLEGRTAIVTGASRGIGLAAAAALAQAGANVMLTSRKEDAVQAAAERVRELEPAGQVAAMAAHAAEAEQAAACVAATRERFGGTVDVLVNNAATNPYMGPLVDIDEPRAAKTVAVNQLGPVLWTKAAMAGGLAEGGGSVINIASVGGLRIDPMIGYYNATKAALIHMTRQLAWELGPDVRVNAIAPGLVKTDLARALWEDKEEQIAAHVPLRRLGEPDDIAAAVLFLAGRGSAWITGHTLVVDGGVVVNPVVAS